MSRLLKIFIFLICLFIVRPAHAQNSQLYLTDYLEFSVFPKLAPQNYQDRLKNAMILRASANPDVNTVTNLYGFTPATTQIHDYELSTPLGKFKLSQLTPKPLDNPQALSAWLNSATAKIWAYVPMFTREDTKGFIEAPSGEVHEVKHPHISRTYEVSSALKLLTPFQTAAPPPPDSSRPEVNNYLTGSGDVARGGIFTTNNPTKSPVKFTTYTPFLKEISDNLIGIYSKNSGIFNIFNIEGPFPADIFALGRDAKTTANQAKFYYPFLGSLHCAQQKVLSFLQPFTGQNINIDPQCQDSSTATGLCDGAAFSKLNPPSTTTTQAKEYFSAYILPNLTPDLIDVYSQASAETEVPCEVLAAIHFMEGNNNPNRSLISGRPLGTPEPDAGNKVFQTLLETATYAGNELKQKINNDLTTMEKLITALSRYNGGGNANCRFSYSCSLANNSAVPSCPVDYCCNLSCRESCAQTHNHTVNDFVYPIPSISFCPRQYEGEDDPYSTNMYNNSHLSMYLLYCLDRTMCTPQLFTRPGVAAVSVEFYYINQ